MSLRSLNIPGRRKVITKNMILEAQKNTKSNMEAARFLRVSYPTYKKYAKMYKDDDTGQSLFEMHKNQQGIGVAKPYNVKKGKYSMEDILEGMYPEYPVSNLKKRIITNSILEEKCDNCNFCERRVTDYTIPLLLDHLDGDRTNHRKTQRRVDIFSRLPYGSPVTPCDTAFPTQSVRHTN